MMTDTRKKVTRKSPVPAGTWRKPGQGNLRLKGLLKRKGYPYRAAAQAIGVSARHLAFVMAGQRPDSRVAALIAALPPRDPAA